MARVSVEMGLGRRGEAPDGFRETAAPDWVRVALLESPGNASVRVIYTDGSFNEWRLKVAR